MHNEPSRNAENQTVNRNSIKSPATHNILCAFRSLAPTPEPRRTSQPAAFPFEARGHWTDDVLVAGRNDMLERIDALESVDAASHQS